MCDVFMAMIILEIFDVLDDLVINVRYIGMSSLRTQHVSSFPMSEWCGE